MHHLTEHSQQPYVLGNHDAFLEGTKEIKQSWRGSERIVGRKAKI